MVVIYQNDRRDCRTSRCGTKMGFLLLQSGWGINAGIGVDVHLHRLALMWGWVSPKANTPEKARIELQEWLPKDYWTDINPLVVGFGQVICVPRAANCDICTLARDGLCKGVNKKLLKPRCLKNGLTSCRNKELISLNYLRSLCKQNLKHLNS